MEKGKKKATVKKTTNVVEPTVKKKDNSQLKATIIGIALMVAAIGLGVGTYAYYQSTITGNISGTITAWSFLVNNSPTTFTADLGNLKPGSNGTIALNLSAAGSGLDVIAEVTVGNKTNWPANLKLYTDSGYTSEIGPSTVITENITKNTSKTVNIYYNWPYGSPGSDVSPTTDETATVAITVVGTQAPNQ